MLPIASRRHDNRFNLIGIWIGPSEQGTSVAAAGFVQGRTRRPIVRNEIVKEGFPRNLATVSHAANREYGRRVDFDEALLPE